MSVAGNDSGGGGDSRGHEGYRARRRLPLCAIVGLTAPSTLGVDAERTLTRVHHAQSPHGGRIALTG